MKKLLFLGSSFLLALFFLVSSCTKDETLSIGKTEVKIKDGMLHFKDIKQFSEMYKYLIEDFSRLKQIENMNFICAKEAFLATNKLNAESPQSESQINTHVAYWREDRNDEKTLLRKIVNPAYEVLLNEQGAVRIGTQIFKHDESAIYIFESRYLSMLDDVKNIPNVQILYKSEGNVKEKRLAECSTVYAYKNGKQWKKVRGYIDAEIIVQTDPYTGNYVIYATGKLFYTAENFKRGLFGAFYASDANELSVSGSGFYYSDQNTSSITYGYFGYPSCEHSVIDDSDSGSCTN